LRAEPQGESGPVTITAQFTGVARHGSRRRCRRGKAWANTFFGFRAPPGKHISELTLDGSQFSGNYALFDDLGFLTTRRETSPAKPEKLLKISAREKEGIARQRLGEFLARAFRHPIDDATLARYLAIQAETAKRAGFSMGMREPQARRSPRRSFSISRRPVRAARMSARLAITNSRRGSPISCGRPRRMPSCWPWPPPGACMMRRNWSGRRAACCAICARKN